jgi:GT2 family glycosyltransferase
MSNRIYILTAVHNYLNDTKKLLESINCQSFKNYEIYLIDDGSTDGTAGFVHQNYPKANVLRGDGNLWWTASLNLGLKKILDKAGIDDYVWIINNDCYFAKDALKNLYNFNKGLKGSKNIVGSVVLDSKTKKVRDTGIKINWRTLRFSSVKPKDLNKATIDALSTKGTLYPVGVFREIGFFDAKHFPHYFSDYELSIRAKINGYNLLVFPKCIIYNESERTGIENSTLIRSSLTGLAGLLFSKKSKVNLLLQFNMIRYVCPKEFRSKSLLFLVSKIIKYIF